MTFANEPLLELRRSWARDGLRDALAALDRELPLDVPVLVDGDARRAPSLDSTDPSRPDRVVARATVATEADIEAAVAAARRDQPAWGARPAAERAEILVRAAALLRERRPRLTALMVRECAKPWAEADADVCEAIDFLEYYARQAVELDRGEDLIQPPGERNTLVYRPRGIAAVIAPWNFPVAIACGMTSAALVTGNAALLKPAEQSPGCALELVTALHEAGVPRSVLALLPGEGDVGAALVRHPAVHVIAFTGSSAVGQEILREAGTVREGDLHLTHVVSEMGGKNCIIVDADADLDDALPAIAYSAFGFAGQKCSACSRVLVHEAVADALVERLGGLLDTLVVDLPERFGVDVPPVIEQASQERLERHVAVAAEAGATVRRGAAGPGTGWFVAPTMVTNADPMSPIAREELFGPVVVVEPVAGVDAACDVLDTLPVALTGGLFSRNPDVVRRVSRRVPVGNFYVNRHITGAIVGRQPFGGNRLSGTGTKAGGPGYLHQFVESIVVCENTMRHGLVV
ncbi:MAG: aldehyde dehydrogenase family protein [Solirubrobacteraceae bacterium]|nr:aldehyde dehydrogenase family protein [Solirubrobacteraceae bacterium]